MKEKERGAASIYIDLRAATITVYRGEDKYILESFTAYKGSWDEIWEGIYNAKNL